MIKEDTNLCLMYNHLLKNYNNLHMDKVVHFELPFDDKARAVNFYKSLFGWNLVDAGTMDYVMAYAAKTDEKHMVSEVGAINGGLFPRDPGAPNPIVCIAVDSIDEKLKEVVAAGGKVILPKIAIPNGGYARITDPEGNIVGLVDSLK